MAYKRTIKQLDYVADKIRSASQQGKTVCYLVASHGAFIDTFGKVCEDQLQAHGDSAALPDFKNASTQKELLDNFAPHSYQFPQYCSFSGFEVDQAEKVHFKFSRFDKHILNHLK
mmetsp:Transcript_11344/g.19110  ORF Transcript_11344/g.19110 Transcript_11344/m.19110 type:complete len:115 (-) Transcript_11344:84-428(-)